MRKYLVTLILISLIASCNNENNKTSSSASTSSANAATDSLSITKGAVLITRYDCATCHQVDKKIIGPAFKEVANRYAGNDTAVTYLANKIINGGGGVWDTIPMSQHINLSELDAELIVKYILSLKTK